MAPEFSDQLEEAHPTSVLRIPSPEDDRLVWKIDLGKKTQRRLFNNIKYSVSDMMSQLTDQSDLTEV